MKRLTENKCFWKTVESFLWYYVRSSERITLADEDDALITNEEEFSLKLNDFFSNALINRTTLKFKDFVSLPKYIKHSTLKAIDKYKNHPSSIEYLRNLLNTAFLLMSSL